ECGGGIVGWNAVRVVDGSGGALSGRSTRPRTMATATTITAMPAAATRHGRYHDRGGGSLAMRARTRARNSGEGSTDSSDASSRSIGSTATAPSTVDAPETIGI